MEDFAHGGHRPQMFWRYEAQALGLRPFNFNTQKSTLYNAGLLGEQERIELVAFWRKQFDLAIMWKEDAATACKRFRSMDIPVVLIRRWRAERKRHARTIDKLKG